MAREEAHRGHGATRGATRAAERCHYSRRDHKRRDAHEHGGLDARRAGGAWRTVRGKLRAGGGGVARSAYRGWWSGCEGAIRAAPMAENGDCRARFATSALRGGSVQMEDCYRCATQPEERGASPHADG